MRWEWWFQTCLSFTKSLHLWYVPGSINSLYKYWIMVIPPLRNHHNNCIGKPWEFRTPAHIFFKLLTAITILPQMAPVAKVLKNFMSSGRVKPLWHCHSWQLFFLCIGWEIFERPHKPPCFFVAKNFNWPLFVSWFVLQFILPIAFNNMAWGFSLHHSESTTVRDIWRIWTKPASQSEAGQFSNYTSWEKSREVSQKDVVLNRNTSVLVNPKFKQLFAWVWDQHERSRHNLTYIQSVFWIHESSLRKFPSLLQQYM